VTYLADTTTAFIRECRKRLQAALPMLQQITSSRLLRQELARIMAPLVEHYFSASLQAANMIMTQNIAQLTSALKVPLKYTKTLFNRIHGTSIFRGYYNTRYGDVFARREIDALKKTILRGAYGDMTEAQIQAEVMKTLKVTERRAQLLARNEVQRLKEEANLIYWEQPEVQEKYEREWVTRKDAVVRPSHQRMNGKLSDADGYFDSPDVGPIKGPGMSGDPKFDMGCRCKTAFKRK
jgi:hypothetical protein